MSYFDDASLVMIPSGYKTSKVYSVKPTDGSGDLTFSRSNDTATRVNSAGLIEKVRTNLVLQSNTFTNVSWVNGDASIAASGSEWSWTANTNSTFHYTYQSHSYTSRLITYSIYAKAGAYGKFNLVEGTTSVGAWFDLSSGTIGSVSPSVTAKISDEGSGWYRVSISFTSSGTSNFLFAFSATETLNYTGSGTIGGYIKQAQLENGDIATDYIATTSAAVSVGPVANVPRLDYLNSSCPRLLLEPQRTNLATYSEQFNNAAWVLDGDGAGQSVTANYAISPDGYQNADRIQLNKTGGSYSRIRQSFTAAYSGATTFSVYLKTNDATTKTAYLRIDGGTSTLITITGNWTRFSITNNWIYSLGYAAELFLDTGSSNTADISAYGAMVEQGSYSTSYIPTLGAAVTRGKDSCLTASVPSLIGQTEGTMFIEFERKSLAADSFFILSNVAGTTVNSYLNSIYFYQLPSGNFVSDCFLSGASQFNFTKTGGLSIGTHKLAIAYKANDFALYIDGVQIATDTSGSVPAMNFLTIGGGADVSSHTQAVNQALLFKTRLSNADLAALTTI